MLRGAPRPLREKLWPTAGEPRDPLHWTESKNELLPDEEPRNGFLHNIKDRIIDGKTRDYDRSIHKIAPYLPPVDLAKIRACSKNVLRFHDPKRALDVYFPVMCGNYYCLRCPHFEHQKRVLYHARKIASLDPTEEYPVPRVVNTVWTLPPELHAWARRDPRVMPGWRRAILRTIAEVYGYKGRQGMTIDRAAFQELGAIMNLHPIGDEAEPWPKWAPHYDLIIPAWKRVGDKIEPLRTTWPDRPYSKTNRRYADNLRRFLLPFAERPQPLLDIAAFLQTDFQTVWHVSKPPRTDSNPEAKGIIHQESAMHRIRYSCRPLFTLSSAGIREDDGRHHLVYTVPKGKRRGVVHHRVPVGPAVVQLESLREWMTGRASRSWAGILSRHQYDATAKLAGHEPVRPKLKKGFVLKAAYELGDDAKYVKRSAARTYGAGLAEGEDEA